MIRAKSSLTILKRSYSQSTHADSARVNVNTLLSQYDRSSLILSKYIPEPARDAFIAIRAFNIEVSKISDGGSNDASVSAKANQQLSGSMGFALSDMKFKFWSDLINGIFIDYESDKFIGEPIGILLRDSLRKELNLDSSYFNRFLQTRKRFLSQKQFNTVEDICSYGEGSYSQLNYLTQGLLLSPQISPSTIHLLEESSSIQSNITDISAHIGQATALATMILSMNYYAQTRNQITLPINLMTKHELSQESIFRFAQGHMKDQTQIADFKEKLKNIIYETATTANDHLLTARDKLKKSQNEIKDLIVSRTDDPMFQFGKRRWRHNLPDALFTPFMVAIPTELYLKKLEKYDFDIYHPRIQTKEWRLAWSSYWNYYKRRI